MDRATTSVAEVNLLSSAEQPVAASNESTSVDPVGTTDQHGNEEKPPGHRLTLHQLGLEGDHALAYALSRDESPDKATVSANDRLRQSMQQDAVDTDRKLGLGVPAPLIRALETAARELSIPTNATALFTANIDGSGNLLGLDFLGANHASPQWAKVSERVEQVLRGRRLSITKNLRGVDFKLRLVARSQLPSGHDPGTAVDVLGIPVKRGQGKRSTKISLLDPTPKFVEFKIGDENDTETVRVPVPGLLLSPLTLAGDPSDIGAPARHMIRVEVVDEKVY